MEYNIIICYSTNVLSLMPSPVEVGVIDETTNGVMGHYNGHFRFIYLNMF